MVGTRSLQLPAVGEKWVTPHTWVALRTLPSKTTCPHFPAGAGQLWGLGDPLRKRDLELAAPIAVAPLLPLPPSSSQGRERPQQGPRADWPVCS